MEPKQMNEDDRALVNNQLEEIYRREFNVHTDKVLNKHRSSYNQSQEDAKFTFGSYMQNFLTLNRDLRTDAYNDIHVYF